MSNQVKLIWDFRGPSAFKIAEHHAIHLKEYVVEEDIKNSRINIEQISTMHTLAFLVVDESLTNQLREKLKPHRGQKYIKE
jgi:hypothetical protein